MDIHVERLKNLEPIYYQGFVCVTLFYLFVHQVTCWRFGKEISSFSRSQSSEFRSAIMAIVHSSLTIILASISLASSPKENEVFSTFTSFVVIHSIVYLLFDSYILRGSTDIAMHLHHWFGIALLVSMILQNRAANYMDAIFIILEGTSPLVNLKIALEQLKRNESVSFACQVLFGLMFMFLRTFPYHKLLYSVWASTYCLLVVKILTSLNYLISANWSYVIFCKFLKAFTRDDGRNPAIIKAFNAMKNFTNKTAAGRATLYLIITYVGLVRPILFTYYPEILKNMSLTQLLQERS